MHRQESAEATADPLYGRVLRFYDALLWELHWQLQATWPIHAEH